LKSPEMLKLAASILICLGAGLVGSFFTTPSISTWYASIQKPSFNPPNWVFAPVWTALFILMGISLFLVWKQGYADRQVKIALVLFAVQLVLNIVWSFMFFGLRNPLAGLIEIVVLWISIVLTIVYFYNISRTAGLLLVPYILWVSFAAFLNFTIWRLNH
jgi:benzodiazapine receptor